MLSPVHILTIKKEDVFGSQVYMHISFQALLLPLPLYQTSIPLHILHVSAKLLLLLLLLL
jgi:hypothetical protein